MVMPVMPPAMRGSVGTPPTAAPAGGCWPNGSCTASDFAWAQDTRSSLTIVGERMRVQPPTRPFDFMTWSPKAEVPVPSTTPPKAPGMKRVRFE